MSIRHELTPGPKPEMLELLANIDTVAEAAYEAVAADPENHLTADEVHVNRKCGAVTDYMIPALRELGYAVPTNRGERHMVNVGWAYDESGKPLAIDKQPEAAESVIHRFPVIDTDGTPEGEVVADATWQQFIPPEQRSPNLPRVLAGTRDSVRAQLQSFGFNDPELLKTWEKPVIPNRHKPHAV